MSSQDVGATRLRRTRDLAAVRRLFEGGEPTTSPTMVALQRLEEKRLGWRAWMAWSEGEPVAALVEWRDSPAYWRAACILSSDTATPAVAAKADRLLAIQINGRGEDIEAIAPLLSRRRGAVQSWPVFAVPGPIEAGDPPPDGTRLARGSDVDALVAMLARYDYVGTMTRRTLRKEVRRAIRDGHAAVAVDGGELVGVILASGCTDRYAVFDAIAVVERHRGRGLSWRLLYRLGAHLVQSGLGLTGFPAQTNPMSFDDRAADYGGGAAGTVSTVWLHRVARFRGHGRLQELHWRLSAPLRVRMRTTD